MNRLYYNTFLIYIVGILVYMTITSKKHDYIGMALFTIILFYFIMADYNLDYKKRLLFTLFVFSIYGYISESYIIKKTNILKYDESKYKDYPYFLPFIYAYWAILVIYLFDLSGYLFKENNIMLRI